MISIFVVKFAVLKQDMFICTATFLSNQRRNCGQTKERTKGEYKEKPCDKPVRTTFGGIHQRKIVCTFNASSVPKR